MLIWDIFGFVPLRGVYIDCGSRPASRVTFVTAKVTNISFGRTKEMDPPVGAGTHIKKTAAQRPTYSFPAREMKKEQPKANR
ncbi:MAG: hypothetical protein H6964_03460 [Chromatiaceae bacterium]|nr:hypothetical protein [Chromatiaceae bacterium]